MDMTLSEPQLFAGIVAIIAAIAKVISVVWPKTPPQVIQNITIQNSTLSGVSFAPPPGRSE